MINIVIIHTKIINSMHKLSAPLTLLLALFINTAQAADEDLLREARQLVKTFAGQLKPELKQALQAGGPAYAISVCAERAPQIASDLSSSSGWNIKRVSLKPRNVANATPDNWERGVLLQFELQLSQEQAISEMYSSAVEQGSFRYMQPQAVEPVCLVCHGESLSDDLKQALEKYAPGDQATGYKLGDIRGAFSLRKPAEATDISF